MMTRGVSGICADRPSSYRRLEGMAACVRKWIQILPEQAVDPLQIFDYLDKFRLRRADGKELRLDSGVIPLDGSEGYARYDAKRDILEVLASEQTYEQLEERHPRAGYFLAHEFGHCILHTDQLVRLARMPTMQHADLHRLQKGHRAYQDTEWQANAFASAFLMPALGLAALEHSHGQLTVQLVADQFSVSQEAARYRLELYGSRKAELIPQFIAETGCNPWMRYQLVFQLDCKQGG